MTGSAAPAGAASRVLARAHGTFNVVSGLWPLLHLRSFEAVTGPKADGWLVKTVAGLMVANGLTQLAAPPTAAGVAQARRVGLGTTLVFAAVDVVYVARGRIGKVYLLDAAVETGWALAWLLTAAGRPGGNGERAGGNA